MRRKIFIFLLFISALISFSCEDKVTVVRFAPVLFDPAAPDSMQKGSIDTSYIFISAFDPDGLEDIDSVYIIVTRPDSTSNGLHFHMYDDGLYGDSTAADGRYTLGIIAPQPENLSGYYTFAFHAYDTQNTSSNNPSVIITAY
jgi:hypothetical protein